MKRLTIGILAHVDSGKTTLSLEIVAEAQAMGGICAFIDAEHALDPGYAARIGVDYGRITVRAQKTRWGSCSARGDLSFNCLLMLAPPEVIDSVVVHELCHRRHMDHSPEFYAEVHRIFPDYDKWHGWLREHGPVLLARAAAATEA